MGGIEQAQYAAENPLDRQVRQYVEQPVNYADSDDEALGVLKQQQRGPVGNDEQVVPMHGQDKYIDFHTVKDEKDDQPIAPRKIGRYPPITSLPISQRTCAEKLVPYIGHEEIPCLMFSSNWNQREDGVSRFIL